jgi:succinoglycan biosynthesis protein ExoL
LVRLVFFGHDALDPALRRRIRAFEGEGVEVDAFTMRRGALADTPWRNVDLGKTRDAAFAQRLTALARARPVVARHRDLLTRADVIYARNLDMLALARWAKRQSGAVGALVYECLDVHRFMTRDDPLGAAMRATERSLLNDVALTVVSSLAFTREYFDKRQPGRTRTQLIENRLPPGYDYGPRPSAPHASGDGRIRIGWFGNLRCRRSLALLLSLAERFPDRVEIVLRGNPARTELGDFETSLADHKNVRFEGRYAWPEDLSKIYGELDLVWAGDFHDPGANSKWLMPNRLYEGGYFGAPPLAPADCETGAWVKSRNVGFVLEEPLEQTLLAFFEKLNRAAIGAARQRLLATPDDAFVQPRGELSAMLAAAVRAAPVRQRE